MLPLNGIRHLQIYVCESLEAFLVCVASNPVTVNASCQLHMEITGKKQRIGTSLAPTKNCSCAKAELAANSKQFTVTISNTCILSSGFYVYTVFRCRYVYNHHHSSHKECVT